MRQRGRSGPAKHWRDFRLSPDGRRIVGTRVEAGVTNLWVQDLARQIEQRIDLPGAAFDGMWSPSDDSLIYTSMRKGHFDAYRLAASELVPKAIVDEPPAEGRDAFVVSRGPPSRDQQYGVEPREYWPLVTGMAEQHVLLRRHVRELVHRHHWHAPAVHWAQ